MDQAQTIAPVVTPLAQAEFTRQLLATALVAHRINAIVTPACDGPQYRAYWIAIAFGHRPEAVEALAASLAMTAGAEAGRITRREGKLLLELAKPAADRQILRAGSLERLTAPAPTAVPLGLAADGTPVWLDLVDPRTPHVVIGGTTGSGKTVLLRWIISRLALQNAPGALGFLMLDPKGFELAPLDRLPHLRHPIASDDAEIQQLLLWSVAEMDRRRAAPGRDPRLIIVIEEVADLLAINRGSGELIARLCQLGRGLGIHVIATTQQPGSASLGAALANFPARILGRVASSTLAYGAAGRARTGADVLLGNGDFILIAAGSIIRFQAPLADDRQWRRLPHVAQVSRLSDLPSLIELADANRDPRGGQTARPLSYERVEKALLAGASPDDLREIFGIGYGRARRLHSAVAGITKKIA